MLLKSLLCEGKASAQERERVRNYYMYVGRTRYGVIEISPSAALRHFCIAVIKIFWRFATLVRRGRCTARTGSLLLSGERRASQHLSRVRACSFWSAMV